jgi:hypothetical protein
MSVFLTISRVILSNPLFRCQGVRKRPSKGCNMPFENLSLAREGIFLALSKGGRHSIRICIREGPFCGHRTRAFSEPPNQYWGDFQQVSEMQALVKRWRREYNHIGHIAHWGIDLLLRGHDPDRSIGVQFRSASHLRLGTNSRSGTKYGGWSSIIR